MSIRLTVLSRIMLALAVMTAGVASAPADDQVFANEITVTATGEEESVEDVPLPVTVITREELDDAQAETVTEMLRRVPGVTVMQSGGSGSLTSVFTRGTESDHTLVLFDGIRLNSPEFGGYDFSQMSTAGLDRIEVARGPYSALWGADAIGGAINFIPARGRGDVSGSLIGEGGEGSWKRYEAFVGYGTETYDLYLSGFKREGEDDLENSDFDLQQGLVDVGWHWGTGSRIAVLYHDVESDLGIPFTAPGSLTPDRRQKSHQRTLAVPLKWRLANDWRIEVTASTVEREFDFSDPNDPWGYTESHTDAESTQARLASHHTLGSHQLSWGGEWREDEVSSTSSYGTALDGMDSTVTSLFAQDVWKIDKDLSLIIGARWDDTDEWGSEFSPRLAFAWVFSDTLEFRVAYGEAYRQPSIGELYFPGFGNPDLVPETSKSFEVGFNLSGPGNGVTLELNAFKTDINDLILFDFLTFSNANIGEAEIKGVEGVVNIPITQDLKSAFQITWLDTQDGFGNALLRRPEWSGSYSLHGALLPWLRGDIALIYVGDRDDVDPITYGTSTADSFFTASMSLALKVWDNAEVTLRATNLLDQEYEEVLGYPAPGRRVLGGLRLDW
ncbi:MAG: TonB-dependent receptor [Thermoanaerobaculales bacterium]|nr:TonB-dependent receptor [Thermoanaerobaculales bacterium]